MAIPLSRRRAAVHNAFTRRKLAQDHSSYAELIADPADLGTAGEGGSLDPLVLPANTRLAVMLDAPTDGGDIQVEVNGRILGTPGAAAGVSQRLDWLERGSTVTVLRDGAPGGTLTLQVMDEWRRTTTIAEGSFSGEGVGDTENDSSVVTSGAFQVTNVNDSNVVTSDSFAV